MPNNPTLYNPENIQPVKERCQDVNKNEITFLGKVWVDTEYNGKYTKLPLLIQREPTSHTIANYHQQNFIGQQHRPIRSNKDTCEIQETIPNKPHYQECGGENTDKTGLLPNTTKSTTNTVPPTRRRKKRTRPNKKIRTFTKTRNNRRRLFRIPRCNYGKNVKTVKIALDARKLNDSCITKRPHMPNMDELLNQISSELSKNKLDGQ